MPDLTQEDMLPQVLGTPVMVQLLYAQHSQDYWQCFDELRIGTGYGKDAEQRIDFWAMASIPSQRFRRIAYEIKLSRADFVREIMNPRKRARALLYSNEFYFCAPVGIIHADEIPPECGLCEVMHEPHGFSLMIRHPAPWRDTMAPSWQFLAACIRRAQRR